MGAEVQPLRSVFQGPGTPQPRTGETVLRRPGGGVLSLTARLEEHLFIDASGRGVPSGPPGPYAGACRGAACLAPRAACSPAASKETARPRLGVCRRLRL